MTPLLLVLLLAGAPARGVTAKDPAQLLERTEATLPKLWGKAPALKNLLLKDEELRSYFQATGMAEDLLDQGLAAAHQEQKAHPEPKPAFAPQHAVVVKRERDWTVHLYSADGRGVALVWVVEGDRLFLIAAPVMEKRTVQDDLKDFKKADATYFQKKKKKWEAGPLPAPAPPGCQELLKVAAREVYVAQSMHRAEFDAFTTDLTKLSLDAQKLKGAEVKVVSADATTFTAELSLKGGVLTITDKNEPAMTRPCSPQ